jgi:phosphotransacetylase
MYRNFKEIVSRAKTLGPRRVAVVFPDEPDVMRAVRDGIQERLIAPVLIGARGRMESAARAAGFPLDHVDIIHEQDPQKAADISADMVKAKKAAFVVKGDILTTFLYKALIRNTRESDPQNVPCTLCFHEAGGLDKIFLITDPGVNIRPDREVKEKILKNALSFFRRVGSQRPKVMILAAERVDGSDSPALRDAAAIRRSAEQGGLGHCEILPEHNLPAGISGGERKSFPFPDIFLVPNIETGNLLVKSIDHLLSGVRQCVTVGEGILLTPSRSDGYEARMTNLALGLVLSATKGE